MAHPTSEQLATNGGEPKENDEILLFKGSVRFSKNERGFYEPNFTVDYKSPYFSGNPLPADEIFNGRIITASQVQGGKVKTITDQALGI